MVYNSNNYSKVAVGCHGQNPGFVLAYICTNSVPRKVAESTDIHQGRKLA